MTTPKKYRACLLAMLAAAVLSSGYPLGAQDPLPAAVLKLTAPATVNIGDLATVSVDPSSNVQDVQFLIAPSPTSPLNVKTGVDFVSFVCGADKPDGGKYTVFAAGNLNGKTITAEAVVTFAKPEPPPTPPGPTPPPASHLWLISVYDTDNPPAEITKLASDSAFWYGVLEQGHRFATFNAADPAAKSYIAAAAKVEVNPPFIMFMDADTKKVLAARPLPADEATINEQIVMLTGRAT